METAIEKDSLKLQKDSTPASDLDGDLVIDWDDTQSDDSVIVIDSSFDIDDGTDESVVIIESYVPRSDDVNVDKDADNDVIIEDAEKSGNNVAGRFEKEKSRCSGISDSEKCTGVTPDIEKWMSDSILQSGEKNDKFPSCDANFGPRFPSPREPGYLEPNVRNEEKSPSCNANFGPRFPSPREPGYLEPNVRNDPAFLWNYSSLLYPLRQSFILNQSSLTLHRNVDIEGSVRYSRPSHLDRGAALASGFKENDSRCDPKPSFKLSSTRDSFYIDKSMDRNNLNKEFVGVGLTSVSSQGTDWPTTDRFQSGTRKVQGFGQPQILGCNDQTKTSAAEGSAVSDIPTSGNKVDSVSTGVGYSEQVLRHRNHLEGGVGSGYHRHPGTWFGEKVRFTDFEKCSTRVANRRHGSMDTSNVRHPDSSGNGGRDCRQGVTKTVRSQSMETNDVSRGLGRNGGRERRQKGSKRRCDLKEDTVTENMSVNTTNSSNSFKKRKKRKKRGKERKEGVTGSKSTRETCENVRGKGQDISESTRETCEKVSGKGQDFVRSEKSNGETQNTCDMSGFSRTMFDLMERDRKKEEKKRQKKFEREKRRMEKAAMKKDAALGNQLTDGGSVSGVVGDDEFGRAVDTMNPDPEGRLPSGAVGESCGELGVGDRKPKIKSGQKMSETVGSRNAPRSAIAEDKVGRESMKMSRKDFDKDGIKIKSGKRKKMSDKDSDKDGIKIKSGKRKKKNRLKEIPASPSPRSDLVDFETFAVPSPKLLKTSANSDTSSERGRSPRRVSDTLSNNDRMKRLKKTVKDVEPKIEKVGAATDQGGLGKPSETSSNSETERVNSSSKKGPDSSTQNVPLKIDVPSLEVETPCTETESVLQTSSPAPKRRKSSKAATDHCSASDSFVSKVCTEAQQCAENFLETSNPCSGGSGSFEKIAFSSKLPLQLPDAMNEEGCSESLSERQILGDIPMTASLPSLVPNGDLKLPVSSTAMDVSDVHVEIEGEEGRDFDNSKDDVKDVRIITEESSTNCGPGHAGDCRALDFVKGFAADEASSSNVNSCDTAMFASSSADTARCDNDGSGKPRGSGSVFGKSLKKREVNSLRKIQKSLKTQSKDWHSLETPSNSLDEFEDDNFLPDLETDSNPLPAVDQVSENGHRLDHQGLDESKTNSDFENEKSHSGFRLNETGVNMGAHRLKCSSEMKNKLKQLTKSALGSIGSRQEIGPVGERQSSANVGGSSGHENGKLCGLSSDVTIDFNGPVEGGEELVEKDRVCDVLVVGNVSSPKKSKIEGFKDSPDNLNTELSDFDSSARRCFGEEGDLNFGGESLSNSSAINQELVKAECTFGSNTVDSKTEHCELDTCAENCVVKQENVCTGFEEDSFPSGSENLVTIEDVESETLNMNNQQSEWDTAAQNCVVKQENVCTGFEGNYFPSVSENLVTVAGIESGTQNMNNQQSESDTGAQNCVVKQENTCSVFEADKLPNSSHSTVMIEGIENGTQSMNNQQSESDTGTQNCFMKQEKCSGFEGDKLPNSSHSTVTVEGIGTLNMNNQQSQLDTGAQNCVVKQENTCIGFEGDKLPNSSHSTVTIGTENGAQNTNNLQSEPDMGAQNCVVKQEKCSGFEADKLKNSSHSTVTVEGIGTLNMNNQQSESDSGAQYCVVKQEKNGVNFEENSRGDSSENQAIPLPAIDSTSLFISSQAVKTKLQQLTKTALSVIGKSEPCPAESVERVENQELGSNSPTRELEKNVELPDRNTSKDWVLSMNVEFASDEVETRTFSQGETEGAHMDNSVLDEAENGRMESPAQLCSSLDLNSTPEKVAAGPDTGRLRLGNLGRLKLSSLTKTALSSLRCDVEEAGPNYTKTNENVVLVFEEDFDLSKIKVKTEPDADSLSPENIKSDCPGTEGSSSLSSRDHGVLVYSANKFHVMKVKCEPREDGLNLENEVVKLEPGLSDKNSGIVKESELSTEKCGNIGDSGGMAMADGGTVKSECPGMNVDSGKSLIAESSHGFVEETNDMSDERVKLENDLGDTSLKDGLPVPQIKTEEQELVSDIGKHELTGKTDVNVEFGRGEFPVPQIKTEQDVRVAGKHELTGKTGVVAEDFLCSGSKGLIEFIEGGQDSGSLPLMTKLELVNTVEDEESKYFVLVDQAVKKENELAAQSENIEGDTRGDSSVYSESKNDMPYDDLVSNLKVKTEILTNSESKKPTCTSTPANCDSSFVAKRTETVPEAEHVDADFESNTSYEKLVFKKTDENVKRIAENLVSCFGKGLQDSGTLSDDKNLESDADSDGASVIFESYDKKMIEIDHETALTDSEVEDRNLVIDLERKTESDIAWSDEESESQDDGTDGALEMDEESKDSAASEVSSLESELSYQESELSDDDGKAESVASDAESVASEAESVASEAESVVSDASGLSDHSEFDDWDSDMRSEPSELNRELNESNASDVSDDPSNVATVNQSYRSESSDDVTEWSDIPSNWSDYVPTPFSSDEEDIQEKPRKRRKKRSKFASLAEDQPRDESTSVKHVEVKRSAVKTDGGGSKRPPIVEKQRRGESTSVKHVEVKRSAVMEDGGQSRRLPMAVKEEVGRPKEEWLSLKPKERQNERVASDNPRTRCISKGEKIWESVLGDLPSETSLNRHQNRERAATSRMVSGNDWADELHSETSLNRHQNSETKLAATSRVASANHWADDLPEISHRTVSQNRQQVQNYPTDGTPANGPQQSRPSSFTSQGSNCRDTHNQETIERPPNVHGPSRQTLSPQRADQEQKGQKKGKKVHQCYECQRTFQRRRGLKVHLHVHRRQTGYKCEYCPEVFRVRRERTRHRTIHHSGRTIYECEKCSRLFKTEAGRRRHSATHNLPVQLGFRCEQCDVMLPTKEEFQTHCDTAHQQESYKCNKCKRQFKVRADVDKHNCPCTKTNKNEFKKRKTAHGQEGYKCQKCEQQFKREGDLDKHDCCCTKGRNAKADNKHVCKYCSAMFTGRKYLTRHVFKCPQRVIMCDKCPMSFNNQDSLELHLLFHAQQDKASVRPSPKPAKKEYRCKYCIQSFSERLNLVIHESLHSQHLNKYDL